MRPGTKRNAGSDPGGFVETVRQTSSHSTPRRADDQRRFAVIIRCFGRDRLWSRYSDPMRAERDCSLLLRHGFDACVEVAS